MLERSERDHIIAEIERLFEKQRATLQEATFIGWTETSRAAFNERAERAAFLLKQIAAAKSAA